MARLFLFVKNVFGALLLLLIAYSSYGQRTSFRYHVYNGENGLDAELVKSIKQDSLSMYYFATDQGLLTLRNDNFHSLPIPEGKSHYFKELYKLHSGELLAVSDDAIYEIKSSYVNGDVELLLECNTAPSAPKYPKHLHQDRNKQVWVADYNHIYKLNGDSVVKYVMDEKNLTLSYIRSFQFLECDNGNMIAVSQKGYFYKFNVRSNSFEELEFKPGFLVHSSYKIGANEFLIGTSSGIIKIIFDFQGKVVHQEIISKEIIASCFEKLTDDRILAGTWFQGLIEIETKDQFKFYPIGTFPYFTVNDIYADGFGKFWVSTNSGAVVLEKKFFSSQFHTANSEYVSSLSVNPKGEIFFSGRNKVFKIKGKQTIIPYNYRFDGSLNTYKSTNEFAAIGTEQGRLYVYKKNQLVFDTLLSEQPITSLEIDLNNEIWVVANKELLKVNFRDRVVSNYFEGFEGKPIVQDICLLKNGNLYIGGEHEHSYLFMYNAETGKIENLSKNFNFELNGDFWIRDLEANKDVLYLGSSLGLLKYDKDTIERVELGKFTDNEINSVTIDEFGALWLATSNGIVRKKKDDISLFSPDHGLPSKTFTLRNLLVDNDGFLWVGTSNGLAYAHATDSIPRTPKPLAYIAKEQSEFVRPESTVMVAANSMLLMDVMAMIYPQNQNQFQFCIVEGDEKVSDWRGLSSKNQIIISDLKPGDYWICIRCKHEGNYAWSECQVLSLEVAQVWYLRWYILLGGVLSILLLIILTSAYGKRKARINLIALEKLVNQRTIQLQEANQELFTANKAKDTFLSIIAHDLRNPFNAIRGFSRILLKDSELLSEEEKQELVQTIHRSSDNTYRLLESLLEWANVQKGNFKLNRKEFDISDILEKNLEMHNNLVSLKELNIKGEFKSTIVNADEAMIDTVVRNLLSNAVKFSYPGQSIVLRSKSKDGFVVVEVADQGMGMTDKQIDQLFKIDTVFTQEGTANETGTGFGLMLCKEFVELNGGEIWVESKKDVGTSFFFSIPVLESTSAFLKTT